MFIRCRYCGHDNQIDDDEIFDAKALAYQYPGSVVVLRCDECDNGILDIDVDD